MTNSNNIMIKNVYITKIITLILFDYTKLLTLYKISYVQIFNIVFDFWTD